DLGQQRPAGEKLCVTGKTLETVRGKQLELAPGVCLAARVAEDHREPHADDGLRGVTRQERRQSRFEFCSAPLLSAQREQVSRIHTPRLQATRLPPIRLPPLG